jgi:hypothetical protein
VIILVIFWFAACYSILQAKGQLKLADDERTKAIILKAIILKAIILLQESVMSIVANSSDAFDDKSILVCFVMLGSERPWSDHDYRHRNTFHFIPATAEAQQRSRQGRARQA